MEALQQKETMAENCIFHLKKYRETVSQEAEAATVEYTVRRTDGCERANLITVRNFLPLFLSLIFPEEDELMKAVDTRNCSHA